MLEAMIVLVIGGLVMAAISSVITAVVRSQRTQELAQQRRSDWSRFTSFLSHEVGEGQSVSTTPSASNNCPTDGFLFSVTVPIATNDGAPVKRDVVFFTTGTGTNTTVFRCGPGIDSTGRLQQSGSTTARLIAGIPLTAVVDPNDNNVIVTLTPSISGANLTPFAVRTRSIVMD